MTISHTQATKLIQEITQVAANKNEAVSVAILDAGANLVAFSRMDKAQLITIDTATGKAFTAVSIGADSQVLHTITQPGQPLAGFQGMTLHPHPLVPFAGGVLIKEGDVVIGAVGVSGASTSEIDEQIAQEALLQ